MNAIETENAMSDSFESKKEKGIIVPIPDPSLKQVPDQGPNFIEMDPPNLQDLEIRVSTDIYNNLDNPENKKVKVYLEKRLLEAESRGFIFRVDNNRLKTEIVYTFINGNSPPG